MSFVPGTSQPSSSRGTRLRSLSIFSSNVAPVLNEDKPTADLEILAVLGAILDTVLGADCVENLGNTKLRVEKPSTSPKIQSQECLAMATCYGRGKDSVNLPGISWKQSLSIFGLFIFFESLWCFQPLLGVLGPPSQCCDAKARLETEWIWHSFLHVYIYFSLENIWPETWEGAYFACHLQALLTLLVRSNGQAKRYICRIQKRAAGRRWEKHI